MYKHILIPIDPAQAEAGPRLIEVSRALAGPDARITLLSVLEPVPSYGGNYISQEHIDAALAEAQTRLTELSRSAGLESEPMLDRGNAANTILETAEKLGCDCIVVASHRPDYRTYLLGSTAARVVRHAHCTVVVERSGQVRP